MIVSNVPQSTTISLKILSSCLRSSHTVEMVYIIEIVYNNRAGLEVDGAGLEVEDWIRQERAA